MVRPVTSKRKLFNSSKDQFKENEPDQINSSESESFASRTHVISSGLYPHHKPLNASKRGLIEGSSCEGRREKEGLSSIDWQKRCEFEDGGNIHTPGRTVMPMSERQQIALLLQLSSPSPTNKSEQNSLSSPQTPTTPNFGRGLTKRNERGETPLHIAAIKGDREKVSQLIAQGANVNATDYAGWTALHEACNRGFLVIASLLIKGGADVNAKGLDNDTPLHDACVNNHFQIVSLLLRSGAKTDAINCRGKTPLDVCRSSRILSLIEETQTGKLEDLEFPEKDFSRVKLQDLEAPLSERDSTTINNNNNHHHHHQDFSSRIHNNNQSFGMSRKTPPNNKTEEKPSITTTTPSSIPTSTTSGIPSNGNGVSSGGNGRPVSPRVTLRLPHVPRTPDKSQQRSHDTKSIPESEDVYEFRCSKEESKESESEEKGESGSKQQREVSPSDTKGDKRPRENDPEDEEELKKKRRKEEGKEGVKSAGRGAGGRPCCGPSQSQRLKLLPKLNEKFIQNSNEKCSKKPSSEKGLKVGQRSTPGNGICSGKQSSTPTSTSVTSSTATSPSSTVTSTNSSNTVSCTSNTEQRKSPSGSAVSSPKPSLGGSKSSAEKSDSDSDSEELKSESSSGAPKVPPLKIVLAPCSLSEQETSSLNGKNGSNRQLPYVVNSSSSNTEEKENASMESKESSVGKEELSAAINSNSSSSSSSGNTSTTASIGTASSTTVVVSSVGNVTSTTMNTSNGSVITTTSVSSDKGSATRITRSQRGGGGSNSSEDQAPVKTEPKTDEQIATDVVHPRKRKLKMKEPETEQIPPSSVPEQPITNCYEMFLKIRKQVERRRKLLFPVQPKPPQGFKDYLMNRCSYVLANSSNSQLSVPIIPAPASLAQALKDLFNEQEQERYKLRLQQLIEKEKLVLSVEQEILRVHGRAARALANQVLPFSVCTILKDEEVYNVISPEQEEKDRNARSRYNGRLFLSWLQDVDDKWEKIKEAMVLRHHNEAESLHAVQKMDWEWKLKELGLVEPNTKAQIDELHVPMVQVADFDLLPA